jgi:hypothetical protein
MDESNLPYWSLGYPERERISFELFPPVSDKHTEGYDWIKASAKIQVGDFYGQTELLLTVSDIIRFKEQVECLYLNLKGYAEFTTIEGQVGIKVETDGLGHMNTSGYLKDDVSSGNKLSFKIEFDQTLLKRTISEIDEALFQLVI